MDMAMAIEMKTDTEIEITLNVNALEREVGKMVEEIFSNEHFTSQTIRTSLLTLHKAVVAILGWHSKEEVKKWVLESLPIDFHPSSVPYEWWLGQEQTFQPSGQAFCSFDALWKSLPEERQKDKVGLISRYLYVLSSMNRYYTEGKTKGKMVEVRLFPFVGDKEGQMMANFWVKDLGKPQTGSYNWHGQDTSQWLFAGCLLSSEDGSLSIHT